MPDTAVSDELRKEFNRWAEAGRGEGMEEDHLPIALPVIEKMKLTPADSVLDVGCGAGWLARRLASLVPQGRVAGIDVSDEMILRAQRASTDIGNLTFNTGEVSQIPLGANLFNHVISIESAYYWPDPAAGVREILRVLRHGGSAWILINYYRDNPHCHQWGKLLAMRTHLLSAGEWAELFRAGGFSKVGHERVADPSPSPEVYTGRWFQDAAQLRAFKQEGALLVYGTK